MRERIYSLRLDIKNSDLPFAIERSICSESGDLIKVFAQFQLQLVQLFQEFNKEEIEILREQIGDDIPF